MRPGDWSLVYNIIVWGTENWNLQFVLLIFLFSLDSFFAVVIMCADPQSIRQIMLTAESENMIDSGEYVFINIELFSRWVQVQNKYINYSATPSGQQQQHNNNTATITITIIATITQTDHL